MTPVSKILTLNCWTQFDSNALETRCTNVIVLRGGINVHYVQTTKTKEVVISRYHFQKQHSESRFITIKHTHNRRLKH